MSNCPEPFIVQLNPYETSRSIQWNEPTFESKQPIKQIFKSKVPGHTFGEGVHVITYVAKTQEGESAKCTFRITLKGKCTFQTFLASGYITFSSLMNEDQ